MTDTIPLQFKRGLTALLGAIPGVTRCDLNRPQPVGENETDDGPVIIIREDRTDSDADNQTTLPLRMQLRISVYVSVVVGGDPADVVVDPYWQAINTIMCGSARELPGVQGVTFLQGQPDAEGEAGRLDLVYTVHLRTFQRDLTIPAP